MNSELLNNTDVLKASGEFLGIDEARCYLQAFFKAEESSVIEDVTTTIVSGQVLGLDKLQIFIDAINNHNVGKPDEEKIVAVRIYSSLSKRVDLSGPEPAPRYEGLTIEKELKDVILEPVLSTGKDFHKGIFPVLKDDLILGMALPCPNLCRLAFNCD